MASDSETIALQSAGAVLHQPDGSESASIVKAESLCMRFGKKEKGVLALDSVSVEIGKGSFTALVGPDGAGKTTFLRMVAGFHTPESGSLTVFGLSPAAHPRQVRQYMGYMPQKFGMYEDLTIQENMNLYADMYSLSARERSERFPRLLEVAGLEPFTARLAGKLSGGMKQKLGLICSLVRTPQLLLLDEPTVGVDPLSRKELWKIIELFRKEEGLALIASTTYFDEAEQCDTVIVLHQGSVLAQGPPGSVRAEAKDLCFSVMPEKRESLLGFQTWLSSHTQEVLDSVPLGGAVRVIRNPADSVQAFLDILAGKEGQATTAKALAKTPVRATARPVEARLEDGVIILLSRQGHFSQEYSPLPAVSGIGPAPVSGVVEASARDAHNAKGTNDANDAKNEVAQQEDSSAIKSQVSLVEPLLARPFEVDLAKKTPIIEVQDLVRKFGTFTAVAGTSFSVYPGEVFGLLGPNGAGKTTIFRMLCGLLPATSGYLRVDGVDLLTARVEARNRVGYVSQKFSLYGTLTVQENMEFFGGGYGLYGASLRGRIAEVLAQYALAGFEKTPAEALAGGLKQRLAMAVGVLHKPSVLFLDEPTSGADVQARRIFWQRIALLASGGTTIVITTHFMEEAEYCDRVLIQDSGKMLALGTPHTIRARAEDIAGHPLHSMEEAFTSIVMHQRRLEGSLAEHGNESLIAPLAEQLSFLPEGTDEGTGTAENASASRFKEVGMEENTAVHSSQDEVWGILQDAAHNKNQTSTGVSARKNGMHNALPASWSRAWPGSKNQSLRRIVALVRKETWQLLRDKGSIVVGVGLPILLLLMFGFGLSLDVKDAKVALVQEDSSPLANEIVAGMYLAPSFAPQRIFSLQEAQQQLAWHDVDAVVYVPSDFSRRVVAGGAQIQVLVSASDPLRASMIQAYVTQALQKGLQRHDDQAGNASGALAQGGISIADRVWFNSANESTWYLVPGVLVLILTLIGAFLMALVVVREHERGTFESLFITPVTSIEIIIAKMIPYLVVGCTGLALCLVAARFVFHVPIRGSLSVLVFCSVLYLFVSLGIGLLISSMAKNQFLASQVALFIAFVPALMLSGFLFDLRSAPLVVQAVGQLLPATHFIALSRTLFLVGDDWVLIGEKSAILAGYAVVLLGLAQRKIRKKMQ